MATDKRSLKDIKDPKARRKAFEKKVDINAFRRSDKKWTFYGGYGEGKPNIASNATRREMGWEQDPDLPDYQVKEESGE